VNPPRPLAPERELDPAIREATIFTVFLPGRSITLSR
jgi:hypothetical protein